MSYPPRLHHELVLLQLPGLDFRSVAIPRVYGLSSLFKAHSPIALQPVFCLPVRNREVEDLHTKQALAPQMTQLSSAMRTLALRRSTANMSLSSGAGGGEPSGPSHSRRQRPESTACGTCKSVNITPWRRGQAARRAPLEYAGTSPALCESESRRRVGTPRACFCSWPCAPAAYVSSGAAIARRTAFAHQETQLELAVVGHDERVAWLADEGAPDSIAILLQRRLVLQVRSASGQTPSLGVDVQRTVHTLLWASKVASLSSGRKQVAAVSRTAAAGMLSNEGTRLHRQYEV